MPSYRKGVPPPLLDPAGLRTPSAASCWPAAVPEGHLGGDPAWGSSLTSHTFPGTVTDSAHTMDLPASAGPSPQTSQRTPSWPACWDQAPGANLPSFPTQACICLSKREPHTLEGLFWEDTTLFQNCPSAQTRDGRPSCSPYSSFRRGARL